MATRPTDATSTGTPSSRHDPRARPPVERDREKKSQAKGEGGKRGDLPLTDHASSEVKKKKGGGTCRPIPL